MSAEFWSELIALNARADALLERCMRASKTTQPIGREIPFLGSVEVRYDLLPTTYDDTPDATSDILAPRNVKQGVFENQGSRVYVRELGFQSYYVKPAISTGDFPTTCDARVPNEITLFPFTWRWNFKTSITDRWYADKRCLAAAGGRATTGNRLAFREPLIIEPRETFIFECEMLGGFGMSAAAPQGLDEATSAVVEMLLAGYREGV